MSDVRVMGSEQEKKRIFEIFCKMEALRIKSKARQKGKKDFIQRPVTDQFFPFFLSLFLILAVLKCTFQIQTISEVLFGDFLFLV